MAVTEQQRRDLFDRVSEQLGGNTAALLMEVTVPANVEYATRGDLKELRAEMLDRFGTLEQRMVEGFAGLDRRITGLDVRTIQGFADVDRRMSEGFAELERRTHTGLTDSDRRIAELDIRATNGVAELERRMTEGFAVIHREIATTQTMIFWRIIPILGLIMTGLVALSTYLGSVIG